MLISAGVGFPATLEAKLEKNAHSLEIFALTGIPKVKAGDDVGGLIADAMRSNGKRWQRGDIVVVAQKIVSKAEGRVRKASDIVPTDEALEYARITGKDARKVQAVLDESTEIVRACDHPPDGVLISRHRQGWICANAAIDESNVGDDDALLLLPEDPDASARRIASRIYDRTGIEPGVIVSDTFGRPWRRGLVNVAIGLSGVPALDSWIGRRDAFGRQLQVSQQATADEVAAAAGLLMAKDGLTPAILVRGLAWKSCSNSHARSYVRPLEEDLFK